MFYITENCEPSSGPNIRFCRRAGVTDRARGLARDRHEAGPSTRHAWVALRATHATGIGMSARRDQQLGQLGGAGTGQASASTTPGSYGCRCGRQASIGGINRVRQRSGAHGHVRVSRISGATAVSCEASIAAKLSSASTGCRA